MNAHKIFMGTLRISGAVLALAGTTAVAYLCERGLTAPWREAALEDKIHAARLRGRKEGDRRARSEAYNAGLEDGRREGYARGRTTGYDEGYLDGFRGDVYLGETPEMLRELGLEPEEHAKQLEARKAKCDAANFEALSRIFAKKPAKKPLTQSEFLEQVEDRWRSVE